MNPAASIAQNAPPIYGWNFPDVDNEWLGGHRSGWHARCKAKGAMKNKNNLIKSFLGFLFVGRWLCRWP
jgi:ABC-type sugar transport system substrate-binding protein